MEFIFSKGKIDWKKSYPIKENESLNDYKKRLKRLSSKYYYYSLDEKSKKEKQKKLNNWRKDNENRIKLYGVEWYNKNKARALWNAAKQRAKKKNLEFNLSLDRIKIAIELGICEITGISFCGEKKRKSAFSPSIDRKDNSKGYTDDNINVVCWGFNTAKNEFSIEDYIKIATSIIQNNKKTSEDILKDKIKDGIDALISLSHKRSVDAGWWNDLFTGAPLNKNKGELLLLCVSEITEAFEGERKNLNDAHIIDMKAVEVELADVFIRLGDYCGKYGYRISEAILRKLEYNLHRADHKRENRVKDGGKKY